MSNLESLTSNYSIESRLQLFSALAEAAEIEHNLMCLYLFAMFSLKRTESEGVSAQELKAIEGWRKVILGVALEEMNHLTLVANLMSSTGASPNFMRPNFPSSPGLYPADIIIELARFDMSTLEHFIYLERPRSQEIQDGETFKHSNQYTRYSPKGRIMPTSGDYQTVGDLYLSIRQAFEDLCAKYDDEKIFCGTKSLQIGPLDSPLPGLNLITSKEEALKAIDTIITQGEGAADVPDSHFNRFKKIKEEYQELLKQNSAFVPARPVARNPVMRKPLNPENRAWVTEPLAAEYMDIANALYILMLRVLVQIYVIENRPKEAKQTLLNTSYTLMHAMASVAETLTHLPTDDSSDCELAGMSFAMVRSLAPLQGKAEKQLLCERLNHIIEKLVSLHDRLEVDRKDDPHAQACIKELRSTAQALSLAAKQISVMPERSDETKKPATAATVAVSAPTASDDRTVKESAKSISSDFHKAASEPVPEIEISETKDIKLLYEGKRCIHSRHCVTELPHVFKANTPGKWIFAENTDAETLAAVARECPSGAIQYERKDGMHGELKPDVNLMRLRENGPYAFLADLEVDGKTMGMRATLCRCGKSNNKPFCDGTHNTVKFTASGEPATMDDSALQARDGKLKIDRLQDGPLQISGNVEICAGTGRIVLRTESVRLCRCGNSKNKPVCDNSHVAAGFKDSVLPVQPEGSPSSLST